MGLLGKALYKWVSLLIKHNPQNAFQMHGDSRQINIIFHNDNAGYNALLSAKGQRA
jgi:hypothetical protein